MLRVLTLATLFPNAAFPRLGTFVERQTVGLARYPGVELRIVSPRGLPPPPFDRIGHYAALRRLPDRELWQGIPLLRPRFLHFPATGGRFDAAAMARSLEPVLGALRREFAFDVIDAEFFFPDGPAATQLGRTFDVPVSVKARGSDIHYWGARRPTRGQLLAAGEAASGLLAVSDSLRQDMIALGLPAAKIATHRTGVDLDLFVPRDRADAKERLGVAGPLVSCVAALLERKGQSVLIAALAYCPGTRLVLIGDGPMRGRLEAEAQRAGVRDRVIFAGSLAHAEVACWLAASDCMALASSSEGLANAWVEALACGTPVVTCDVGGAREVICSAAAGRIVARQPEAFATAIRELLACPPAPSEVRRAAEPFTWAANTAALHAHLSSLI